MELLLPGSPVIFLLAWFGWRIASRAGYSGFWGLTALIPPIGLLALWSLAMQKDWPLQTGIKPSVSSAANPTGGTITVRRPTEPARPRS
jgi:hypothetical protein